MTGLISAVGKLQLMGPHALVYLPLAICPMVNFLCVCDSAKDMLASISKNILTAEWEDCWVGPQAHHVNAEGLMDAFWQC